MVSAAPPISSPDMLRPSFGSLSTGSTWLGLESLSLDSCGLRPRIVESVAQHLPDLTFEEFLEFVRVERDGDEGGIVPFELWPHLLERARSWQQHNSEIILKARQLGISTLAEAFALYTGLHGGQVLVISKAAADGKDFARKVLIQYDELPQSMQRPTLVRNTEEISFAGGGRIIVRAPTEHAGRSQANALVIIDEAAFHPFALANYKAYRPTISAGGQLIIISTANGASGFFYDQWARAQAHETPYDPVFIPWWARPDRQLGDLTRREMVPSSQWLERERSAFTGLPGDFAQEYPADDGEAFTTHSGLVYGLDVDGVAIFSRAQNVQPAPCTWEQCKWRVVGIDPGGRDPNAMVAIGVTVDERLHVYGELLGRGAWPVDRFQDWLQRWHSIAPVGAVVVDPSAKIAATLLGNGWPAYPANNDKTLRLSTMSQMLRSRRLTIDPSCKELIHQLETYWFAPRKDDETGGNALLTRTPGDHHADLPDCCGYAVLEIEAGLPVAPTGMSLEVNW